MEEKDKQPTPSTTEEAPTPHVAPNPTLSTASTLPPLPTINLTFTPITPTFIQNLTINIQPHIPVIAKVLGNNDAERAAFNAQLNYSSRPKLKIQEKEIYSAILKSHTKEHQKLISDCLIAPHNSAIKLNDLSKSAQPHSYIPLYQNTSIWLKAIAEEIFSTTSDKEEVTDKDTLATMLIDIVEARTDKEVGQQIKSGRCKEVTKEDYLMLLNQTSLTQTESSTAVLERITKNIAENPGKYRDHICKE